MNSVFPHVTHTAPRLQVEEVSVVLLEDHHLDALAVRRRRVAVADTLDAVHGAILVAGEDGESVDVVVSGVESGGTLVAEAGRETRERGIGRKCVDVVSLSS